MVGFVTYIDHLYKSNNTKWWGNKSYVGVKFIYLTTTKHKFEEYYDPVYIASPRATTERNNSKI